MDKPTTTKKNIRPQQAAPVQRETTATSSQGGTGLTPLELNGVMGVPFAGDDAE